jgi:hypothetical protein
MRLIAVTMLRNEADILPDFLGHCAALFDEVLAVDHASTDGSAEMLAAAARRMPLTVLRFAQKPYVQSLLVTALAREAFARGADWVFPLDADEFPMVASRADLLARLPADAAAVLWRWRNLWPLGGAGFAQFTAAGGHETLPLSSDAAIKIAISRRVPALLPDFAIGQGSHNVARLRDHMGAHADQRHGPPRVPGDVRHALPAKSQPLGHCRGQRPHHQVGAQQAGPSGHEVEHGVGVRAWGEHRGRT